MGDVAECPLVVSMRGYDMSSRGPRPAGLLRRGLGPRRRAALPRRGHVAARAAAWLPARHAARLIPPAVDSLASPGTRTARERPAGRPSRSPGCTGRRATCTGCWRFASWSTPGSSSSTGSSAPARTPTRFTPRQDLGLAARADARRLPRDGARGDARGDLLLHPAVSEGFGNAVMEAQAAACRSSAPTPTGCAEHRRRRDRLRGRAPRPRRARGGDHAAHGPRAAAPDGRGRPPRTSASASPPHRQVDAFLALYEETITAAGRRPGQRLAVDLERVEALAVLDVFSAPVTIGSLRFSCLARSICARRRPPCAPVSRAARARTGHPVLADRRAPARTAAGERRIVQLERDEAAAESGSTATGFQPAARS